MTAPTQRSLTPVERPTRRRRGVAFDLLRVPLVGRFLKWHWSRTVLQIPLVLLSLVMIIHALWGPQLAPKNLGTLLTWVHFRGLVVVVILLAGNLFCMACPFMLPRAIARKLFKPKWSWPRALRNKWLAIALFVGVLFAYELFDLWSNPWWTGMLILGYFVAALVIDTLFRRASFCKYVCPVGQFNFLSSTLSPLEVAVRDKDTCLDCKTKDCIRGVRAETSPANQEANHQTSSSNLQLPVIQRGCELALFQPRKVGNLDCTFCLDCVYACPHDNVGIVSRLPADELSAEGARSGLGRIERRFDFTVLAVVFTFGAILNAFAMISPVYALEQWIADQTGLRVEWPILSAMFVVGLVLEPALLLGCAALFTRWATRSAESVLSIVKRYARSLLPVGFGIWLAHYGFHFLTGCLTVIPVAQNAVLRFVGSPMLGEPMWQLGGMSEATVFPLELGFLTLGLIGSLAVTWTVSLRGASHDAGNRARVASAGVDRMTVLSFLPWAILHVALYVAAIWIMMQPMDMRGTFLGG